MATTYSYTERGETAGKHGGGGGGSVLPWLLGGGALLFIIGRKVKKDIDYNIIQPKKTLAYAERLQLTGAKFRLDLKRKQVDIMFTVNNPNPKPMHIDAVVGRVTMHSNNAAQSFVIGNIDKFGVLDLAPVSQKQITLTAKMNAINSIAYLAEVLQGKWQGQFINFQGTITANGGPGLLMKRSNLVCNAHNRKRN